MRKIAFPVAALMALFVVAAVAFAQSQVNTYTVSGSVTGGKGSKAKPAPVSVKFSYQVGEQSGGRPSPVKQYTIGFYGVRSVNGDKFPKCTAAQINSAKSDRACPSGSKVGSGSIKNASGATSNIQDKSIACNVTVTVYNSGKGKAALFIAGSPSGTGASKCAIQIAQAIDVKYVNQTGGGTALQFSVPPGLLHPIPGVDNAVVDVTSTIQKRTVKKSGKTYAYYESVGCKGSTRPVSVKFTPENGAAKTATKNGKC